MQLLVWLLNSIHQTFISEVAGLSLYTKESEDTTQHEEQALQQDVLQRQSGIPRPWPREYSSPPEERMQDLRHSTFYSSSLGALNEASMDADRGDEGTGVPGGYIGMWTSIPEYSAMQALDILTCSVALWFAAGAMGAPILRCGQGTLKYFFHPQNSMM